MTAQDAYKTFEKISKQINEIKVLYNHLKNDSELMNDKQLKFQSRKILNKISNVDIDELKECVNFLKEYVVYDEIKKTSSTLINNLNKIKDYLYSQEETESDIEVTPNAIESIKHKYEFLQKMVDDGSAENSIIIKDANRLDNLLSRINYENLSETDYEELVNMKNSVADIIKTLKSIEKSDKYGPFLRSPLYKLIYSYITRGNEEEAKKLTNDALDFIENPNMSNIEMFEPAIKRIIADKMTQPEFNKFYNMIESGIKRSKGKFESFNSYINGKT